MVGHYGCGGVHASITGLRVGLADNGLRHVGDVASKHAPMLAAIESEAARHARLCESNVIEPVVNACQTTVVQDAWARDQPLAVHGRVYSLHDGRVRDLHMHVDQPGELAGEYADALARVGDLQPATPANQGRTPA